MTIDAASAREQAHFDLLSAKMALAGTVASLAPAARAEVTRRMTLAFAHAAAAVEGGDGAAALAAGGARELVRGIRRLSMAAGPGGGVGGGAGGSQGPAVWGSGLAAGGAGTAMPPRHTSGDPAAAAAASLRLGGAATAAAAKRPAGAAPLSAAGAAAEAAAAGYGGPRLHKRQPQARVRDPRQLAREAAYRSLAQPGDFWALTPDEVRTVLAAFCDAGGPLFKEAVSVQFAECACVELGRAARPCSGAAAAGAAAGSGSGSDTASVRSGGGGGGSGPAFACRATVAALRATVFTQAELEDRNLALWQEAAAEEAVLEAAEDAAEALQHHDVRAGLAERALQLAFADEEGMRRRAFEGGVVGAHRHRLDAISAAHDRERAAAAARALRRVQGLLAREAAARREIAQLRQLPTEGLSPGAAAGGGDGASDADAAVAASQPAASSGGLARSPRLRLPGAPSSKVLRLSSLSVENRSALQAGHAAVIDLERTRLERAAALAGELEGIGEELAADVLQEALDRIAEREAAAVAVVWRDIKRGCKAYSRLAWWQRSWYAFLLGRQHDDLIAGHVAELQAAYVAQREAAAKEAAGRAFGAIRRVVGRWRLSGLRNVFAAWHTYAADRAARRKVGK
jgi:hypothetical protein